MTVIQKPETGGEDAALPPPVPAATAGALVRPTVWRTTFASLSERDYAWYFVGNIAFFMGMQMQFVLRGFLALELTGRATSLGIIGVTIALPMLIAAPFGGVVADRVNKRLLLILTQTGAVCAALTMALMVFTEWIEFWHLAIVSLVTGIIFAFNMPARQALVPQLVPQHKLMNAISLQMGGMNLTRIIAPALGGLLIAPLGIGGVYLVIASLFAIATVSEFQLPRHGMVGKREAASTVLEDLAGGFRFIRATPLIALLILSGLLLPIFAFPVQQMLPVFAKDVFGRGPEGLGVLAAMTGVGGLIGAMISANLDRQPFKGRIMLIGGTVMGVFLVAFGLASNFASALVFLAIANIGSMLFMATNNATVQAMLPDAVRGRVMSVLLMSFGMMPLGVLPITIASDIIGPQITIAISSTLMLVVIAVLFACSRRLRTLRLDALKQVELSPAQAAKLVAEGTLTQEQADELTGVASRGVGGAAQR